MNSDVLFSSLLFFGFLIVVFCDEIIRKTRHGTIRGLKQKSHEYGTNYEAYLGIRYGHAPKRFEESVLAEFSEDEYNATYSRTLCISILFGEATTDTEDCLFLDLYVPETNNATLSTMVWIHGGGFFGGEAQYNTTFDPEHLLQDDVIIVTVSYRLGIFGFLSTGNGSLPGNYGLKDLVIALKWVQDNIEYFNGDPKNVTIYGQSAGAALVSYLVQSPLTIGKGYFKGAIAQSGNTLNPWALQNHPLSTFIGVAAVSGCLGSIDFHKIIKCLKGKNLETIKTASRIIGFAKLVSLGFQTDLPYAPVLEEGVVPEAYNVLKNRNFPKIPLLLGDVTEEALGFLPYLTFFRISLINMDINQKLLIPEDIYATDEDIYKFIIPKIKDYYFKNNSVVLAKDEEIIKYLSNNLFDRSLREYFTVVGNYTPTFCYQFSYDGSMGMDKQRRPGLGNTTHAEELEYLQSWKNCSEYPKKDCITRRRMVRLWTNFAKFGNPTPSDDSLLNNITWPTAYVGETNIKCLNIDKKLKIIDNPKEEEYQTWKTLYDTYGHPRDTYK